MQMGNNPCTAGQDMSSARGQFTYQLKEYATVICVKYRIQFYFDSDIQCSLFQRSLAAITAGVRSKYVSVSWCVRCAGRYASYVYLHKAESALYGHQLRLIKAQSAKDSHKCLQEQL